jgi:hypothetical protein
VLEALRDLSAPRALVIRDGQTMRIAGREVVAGDILVLEQGDRVAADACLLEARELEADEALLTGDPCLCASARSALSEQADAQPGVMICRWFSPARSSRAAGAWPGPRPPASQPHRADRAIAGHAGNRSAAPPEGNLAGGNAVRHRRAGDRGAGGAALAGCADHGWMPCWPGSPRPCRCCQRNFRWC